MTGRAGELLEWYEYSDYGVPTIYAPGGAVRGASAIDNQFLYTGQRWFADLGLYYYRNRWYDPHLGRFLSRDPLGIWGDPMNLGNGTAYVGLNPWTFVDPLGLEGCPTTPDWNTDSGTYGKGDVLRDTMVGTAKTALKPGVIFLGWLGGVTDRVNQAVFGGLADAATESTFGAAIDGLEAHNRLTEETGGGFDAQTSGKAESVRESISGLFVDTAGVGASAVAGGAVGSVVRGADVITDSTRLLPAPPSKPTTTVLSNVTVKSHGKTVGVGDVYLGGILDGIGSGSIRPRCVFENDEKLLPTRALGYYKEYDVPTPGVSGRGSQRVVRGEGGELYYTPDHYKSFIPLN